MRYIVFDKNYQPHTVPHAAYLHRTKAETEAAEVAAADAAVVEAETCAAVVSAGEAGDGPHMSPPHKHTCIHIYMHTH